MRENGQKSQADGSSMNPQTGFTGLVGGPEGCTWVSMALCHRRAPPVNVSGGEASLLREMLASLITEPREPFTRWIRDLSRHD